MHFAALGLNGLVFSQGIKLDGSTKFSRDASLARSLGIHMVLPNDAFLIYSHLFSLLQSHTGALDSKESACHAGDPGLIPGLGRSPGKRNDYPLQYSYLENSMDRAIWQAKVHAVTNSRTCLSD